MTGGRLAVPPRTRSASGWADMSSSEADKYTPAERGRETERGGVQRVSAHACALCTSIVHVGCVVAGDEQCNVVRLVRRIIKIL